MRATALLCLCTSCEAAARLLRAAPPAQLNLEQWRTKLYGPEKDGTIDDDEMLSNQDLQAQYVAEGGIIPSTLVTSGRYSGMGQCSMRLVNEMEQECGRNISDGGFCKRTDFIQSHSKHWLHDHVPVGTPAADESKRQWKINTSYSVDGAKVRMLSPHGIYLVEGFLTAPEANELVETFENNAFPISMSIGCPVLRHDCFNPAFLTYPSKDHCELRHATSKSFPDNPRWKGVSNVKRKIELLTRVPRQFSEDLQLSKYKPGDFFSAHFDDDACHEQLPDVPEKCHLAKRRMITVLSHLTDHSEDSGGATYFPDLDIRVKPRKGDAVVFFPVYLDGTLNPYMRHTGEDAYETKFVAQQFIGVGGAWHQEAELAATEPGTGGAEVDNFLGDPGWDKARNLLRRSVQA